MITDPETKRKIVEYLDREGYNFPLDENGDFDLDSITIFEDGSELRDWVIDLIISTYGKDVWDGLGWYIDVDAMIDDMFTNGELESARVPSELIDPNVEGAMWIVYIKVDW